MAAVIPVAHLSRREIIAAAEAYLDQHGAVCAAITALLSQHRTLVGVPFALHAKPRAKRSEIESNKMEVQPQLHSALRREGLYTSKTPKVETGSPLKR